MSLQTPRALVAGLLMMAPLLNAMAQDRLEMQGTAITGNRELPSMLYIVPWKSPHAVDLGDLPFASVLNEAPQPVEPAAYRRKVQLFHQLYPARERNKP